MNRVDFQAWLIVEAIMVIGGTIVNSVIFVVLKLCGF